MVTTRPRTRASWARPAVSGANTHRVPEACIPVTGRAYARQLRPAPRTVTGPFPGAGSATEGPGWGPPL